MERSRKQLLELTRCGLWDDKPNIAIFDEGVDWAKVLQLTKEQTLSGLVSVAIEKLPSTLRPKRTETLRLHQIVSLNRQYRTHQVEVLGRLLDMVKRAGVERPVLLKGLGVGLNYHDPSLRLCGDIDLYVGEENYHKVWDFVCAELNIEKEESHSEHHFDFDFMETNIEIHQFATAPKSVVFQGQEFVSWAKEQLEGDKVREVSIDGVLVYLPSYNFDFIFIFYHMWRHFLMGGVGLRQLCDWGCYVNAFSDRLDQAEIKRLVALFRLQKSISIFATIAVKGLGVPAEKFFGLASADESSYKSVLDRIWSRGNFGSYNVDLQRRTKGFVARKFLGSIAMCRDMGYLMSLDWQYALKFYRMSFVRSVKMAIKGI